MKRYGRMASTPERAAPSHSGSHGKPFAIDSVRGLNSSGTLGNESLRPGEEGELEGDGLGDTSESDTDAEWLEGDGHSELSVESDSDGVDAPLGVFFEDGLR